MRIGVADLALALVFVTAGLPFATDLSAQSSSASVQTSVTVAPPPILLENLRNLQFGSVTPGQVVTVNAVGPHAPGTISAGARFTGIRKQDDYDIRFQLPTHLVNGSSSIPVFWDSTQYGWLCIWTTSASNCDARQLAFSPHLYTSSPLLIVIPNNTPGNNYTGDVYLGGRLAVPSAGVTPGVYTGTITIYLTRVS
jgi:hypothetical protein